MKLNGILKTLSTLMALFSLSLTAQTIQDDIKEFRELSERAEITEINRNEQKDFRIDVALEAASWYCKNHPELSAQQIAENSVKIKEFVNRNFDESASQISEAERKQGLHDMIEFLEGAGNLSPGTSAKKFGQMLFNGAERSHNEERAQKGGENAKTVFGGKNYFPPSTPRRIEDHFFHSKYDVKFKKAIDQILIKTNHGSTLFSTYEEFRSRNLRAHKDYQTSKTAKNVELLVADETLTKSDLITLKARQRKTIHGIAVISEKLQRIEDESASLKKDKGKEKEKAALEAKKYLAQQELQDALRFGSSANNFISRLISQSDPKMGQIVQKSGEVLLVLFDSVQKLDRSTKGIEKGIITLDFMNACMGLAQFVLTYGQPTEAEVLLDAIKMVQDNVNSLRIEMRESFQHLDESQRLRFMAVHNHLNAVYAALDTRLVDIQKEVTFGHNSIRQQLTGVLQSTNNIEASTKALQNVLSEKMVDDSSLSYESWKDRCLSENFNYTESFDPTSKHFVPGRYEECVSAFSTCALSAVKKSRFAGGNESVFNSVTHQNEPISTAPIPDILREVSLIFPNLSSPWNKTNDAFALAERFGDPVRPFFVENGKITSNRVGNPVQWLFCTDAVVQLVKGWPQHFARMASKGNEKMLGMNKIFDEGKKIRDAVVGLVVDSKGNPATKRLINLLDAYENEANQLQDYIDLEGQLYAREFFKGYNPLGSIAQDPLPVDEGKPEVLTMSPCIEKEQPKVSLGGLEYDWLTTSFRNNKLFVRMDNENVDEIIERNGQHFFGEAIGFTVQPMTNPLPLPDDFAKKFSKTLVAAHHLLPNQKVSVCYDNVGWVWHKTKRQTDVFERNNPSGSLKFSIPISAKKVIGVVGLTVHIKAGEGKSSVVQSIDLVGDTLYPYAMIVGFSNIAAEFKTSKEKGGGTPEFHKRFDFSLTTTNEALLAEAPHFKRELEKIKFSDKNNLAREIKLEEAFSKKAKEQEIHLEKRLREGLFEDSLKRLDGAKRALALLLTMEMGSEDAANGVVSVLGDYKSISKSSRFAHAGQNLKASVRDVRKILLENIDWKAVYRGNPIVIALGDKLDELRAVASQQQILVAAELSENIPSNSKDPVIDEKRTEEDRLADQVLNSEVKESEIEEDWTSTFVMSRRRGYSPLEAKWMVAALKAGYHSSEAKFLILSELRNNINHKTEATPTQIQLNAMLAKIRKQIAVVAKEIDEKDIEELAANYYLALRASGESEKAERKAKKMASYQREGMRDHLDSALLPLYAEGRTNVWLTTKQAAVVYAKARQSGLSALASEGYVRTEGIKTAELVSDEFNDFDLALYSEFRNRYFEQFESSFRKKESEKKGMNADAASESAKFAVDSLVAVEQKYRQEAIDVGMDRSRAVFYAEGRSKGMDRKTARKYAYQAPKFFHEVSQSFTKTNISRRRLSVDMFTFYIDARFRGESQERSNLFAEAGSNEIPVQNASYYVEGRVKQFHTITAEYYATLRSQGVETVDSERNAKEREKTFWDEFLRHWRPSEVSYAEATLLSYYEVALRFDQQLSAAESMIRSDAKKIQDLHTLVFLQHRMHFDHPLNVENFVTARMRGMSSGEAVLYSYALDQGKSSSEAISYVENWVRNFSKSREDYLKTNNNRYPERLTVTPFGNAGPQKNESKLVAAEVGSISFAELKENGSVVTWGLRAYPSKEVADKLHFGVKDIFANQSGFAALRRDGSVVSWGFPTSDDPSTANSKLLSGINQIWPQRHSFVAFKEDHSVVTWGHTKTGKDRPLPSEFASGINEVFVTRHAIAGLKAGGSAVFARLDPDYWDNNTLWPDDGYQDGWEDSARVHLSSQVETILATDAGFIAKKTDGKIIPWGPLAKGVSDVRVLVDGRAKRLVNTDFDCAVLNSDGTVVTWELPRFDENPDSLAISNEGSRDVDEIFANRNSFAALKRDGSVVSWGRKALIRSEIYTDFLEVADRLKSGVKTIVPSSYAFAALKNDGSVVTWGHNVDDKKVSVQLSGGATNLIGNEHFFAARKRNGSVVFWPRPDIEGNSIPVMETDLGSRESEIYSTPSRPIFFKEAGSILVFPFYPILKTDAFMEILPGDRN